MSYEIKTIFLCKLRFSNLTDPNINVFAIFNLESLSMFFLLVEQEIKFYKNSELDSPSLLIFERNSAVF